uniref:Secreted protein n=1 Tax=Oryza nivara TaxID=4536 RepID=A0A0E0FI89_ORYNI
MRASKLVFTIFVLLTPYLDNYQDNGEHDKERSNSYKHRNQRSPSAVKLRVEFCRINWSLLADHTTATGSGRQEVMSANSPASVQMVDRFAECPGLSKQQVWRVRPAVVRKKMRRKLTGAMAMPGTDNRSVQAGNESH